MTRRDVPPDIARTRQEKSKKLVIQKSNARAVAFGKTFMWSGGMVCQSSSACHELLNAANTHHVKQGACKAVKQRAASLSQQKK